jgi:Domain of unknown function (DUF4160)
MPTLYRTANWKIAMYAGDHLPPHFHVLMRDGREVQIEIATLVVMAGAVPPPVLRTALGWAERNRPLLGAEWDRLPPLR